MSLACIVSDPKCAVILCLFSFSCFTVVLTGFHQFDMIPIGMIFFCFSCFGFFELEYVELYFSVYVEIFQQLRIQVLSFASSLFSSGTLIMCILHHCNAPPICSPPSFFCVHIWIVFILTVHYFFFSKKLIPPR